jgi:hypothetical protein
MPSRVAGYRPPASSPTNFSDGVISLDVAAPRHWHSATGKYALEARLLLIGDKSIRLLKNDGTSWDVPLNWLSQSDAQYIAQFAASTARSTVPKLADRRAAGERAAASLKGFGNVTAASAMRRWTDATGRFSRLGRLVWSAPNKVVILKPDGGLCTVATGRLSVADRNVVQMSAVVVASIEDTLRIGGHPAAN